MFVVVQRLPLAILCSVLPFKLRDYLFRPDEAIKHRLQLRVGIVPQSEMKGYAFDVGGEGEVVADIERVAVFRPLTEGVDRLAEVQRQGVAEGGLNRRSRSCGWIFRVGDGREGAGDIGYCWQSQGAVGRPEEVAGKPYRLHPVDLDRRAPSRAGRVTVAWLAVERS